MIHQSICNRCSKPTFAIHGWLKELHAAVLICSDCNSLLENNIKERSLFYARIALESAYQHPPHILIGILSNIEEYTHDLTPAQHILARQLQEKILSVLDSHLHARSK